MNSPLINDQMVALIYKYSLKYYTLFSEKVIKDLESGDQIKCTSPMGWGCVIFASHPDESILKTCTSIKNASKSYKLTS